MLEAVAQAGDNGSEAVDGLWCDFTATNDLVLDGLVQAAGSTAVLTHSDLIRPHRHDLFDASRQVG